MTIVIMVDHFRNAQSLHRNARYSEAELEYLMALASNPSASAALHYLGVLYSQSGRAAESLRMLDRSIEVTSTEASYYLNRSLVRERSGSITGARLDLFDSLRLDPYSHEAYLRLADLGRDEHRYLEASQYYSKAIALRPQCPKTWMNLGASYDSEKSFAAALRCYDIASISDPDWPDPVLNSALCNLLLGHYQPGWDQYEKRWEVESLLVSPDMTKPLKTSRLAFSGDSHASTVLVWAEQGLGDEIMFGSLINEFSRSCRKLIVQCDKRLQPLFVRSLPDVRFFSRTEIVPESEYDFHIPMGSLPRFLRADRQAFAEHQGVYLLADTERAKSLRDSASGGGRPRIGISWGSARGEARCIPLEHLVTSIDVPGADLVCLQYGEVDSHLIRAERLTGIRVRREPTVDVTNDIDGLAALIASCDAIVTVGNATAHLAGAIGKKSFVLLPYHPGWRWLNVGDSSPWYPNLKLLRQRKRGDWSHVLMELREHLQKLFVA